MNSITLIDTDTLYTAQIHPHTKMTLLLVVHRPSLWAACLWFRGWKTTSRMCGTSVTSRPSLSSVWLWSAGDSSDPLDKSICAHHSIRGHWGNSDQFNQSFMYLCYKACMPFSIFLLFFSCILPSFAHNRWIYFVTWLLTGCTVLFDRMSPWSYEFGRAVMAIDYMVFTLRLIHIFAIHKQLGPKIIILGKMVSAHKFHKTTRGARKCVKMQCAVSHKPNVFVQHHQMGNNQLLARLQPQVEQLGR